MDIGYAVGCLLSIFFWGIDRQKVFCFISKSLRKALKRDIFLNLFYITFLAVLYLILSRINFVGQVEKEVFNCITAMLVVDISNTERKNINRNDKIYFYNSISTISRSLVCGFIAPFIWILVFGNVFAIIYMFIYNFYQAEKIIILEIIFNLLTVIPAFFALVFMYAIYIVKNRRISISFEGEFFKNSIFRPLLNVDVIAAYMEKVNFYEYYSKNDVEYFKCYGKYNNKIDYGCIKNYLGIEYSISLMSFLLFFLVITLK